MRYGTVRLGNIPRGITADEFGEIKSYAMRILPLDLLFRRMESMTSLTRNCSPKTVIHALLVPDVPIVTATLWQGFLDRLERDTDPTSPNSFVYEGSSVPQASRPVKASSPDERSEIRDSRHEVASPGRTPEHSLAVSPSARIGRRAW